MLHLYAEFDEDIFVSIEEDIFSSIDLRVFIVITHTDRGKESYKFLDKHL